MARKFLVLSGLLFSTMSLALPNPSYVHCMETGGSYETRVDSEGNQDGVCMFDQDGMPSECGGWAYFHGTCQPGDCALWSVDTHKCEVPIMHVDG